MGRNEESRSPCLACQRLTALRSQSCFSAPSCGAMNSGNSGTTLEWPGRPPSPPTSYDTSRSCRWRACASRNSGTRALRAEILGAVPGDQGSLAKPAKGGPQRRRGEQLLQALETGLQQRRIGRVEHVADVIVGRDFLDPEQALAVRAAMALLQGALERQKRRALHEKQGERRKPKIRHRNVAAASLPGVRKGRAHRPQTSQKGWQKLHPNDESHSPLIWESPKCATLPLLELLDISWGSCARQSA